MKTLYIRKRKTIYAIDPEGNRTLHAGFESNNLAKKASRLLQLQNGGRLGSGVLRVER